MDMLSEEDDFLTSREIDPGRLCAGKFDFLGFSMASNIRISYAVTLLISSNVKR